MNLQSGINDEKNKNPTKNEELAAETVDFDKILAEEVGQFGWFQARNILMCLIAVVFLAWNNNLYVFAAARISTRCHIPECDLAEPEFSPNWLLNAIPGTSSDSFDNCQRYGNASTSTIEEGVCPAAWFDQNKTQGCKRYLYENTDSFVYDFNMACDEWRRSLVGTIRISGTMFAQTICGYVSDRWGRRTALVFNSFNCVWLGVLKSFSVNYNMFVTVDFFSSVLGSATFQSAFILLMELVSLEKRVFVGAWMNTFLSLGLMTLGLIAWAVPYWRNLTRTVCIPPIIAISYLWFMTESIRWYISKGRYKDTEKALRIGAKANGRQISEKSLEILKEKSEESEQKQRESKQKKQTRDQPSLIKLLFQHKTILSRCLITPFIWITFTLIYQGLTINSVDIIPGNKYLNYVAVSAAQIPGFWISLFTLDKIGRKPILIAAYWICAACQIAFIFVPKSQYGLSLSVYMVGATCSGAMLSSLYIYTAELYPTPYRHRLFGFSSTFGRFGAILATLTPALGARIWEKFPSALFAGCACVAGALVLLLPETRGARLPDSMQEAADLGRKKQSPTTT